MKKFWSWFGIFFVILLLMSNWMVFVGAIVLYFGFKKFKKYKKEKQLQKALEAQLKLKKESQSTIEYKMERLLTITKNLDPNRSKRQEYKTKQQLNLRDYWYKYLDLRAKLILNDTSTYREEEVLHIMCDELLNRMDKLEIEVTDAVKKEFIEENLMPLLRDVVEIMEGISPVKSININAYRLLKQIHND